MTQDIRWHQRLDHFSAALAELTLDIDILKKRQLSRTEEKGLIKSFEFTFELAWNCMKDFFEHQGEKNIYGSRDAVRVAFRRDLIENGELWMKMIDDRIATVHTYNKKVADEIADHIIKKYYPEFIVLQKKLRTLKISS